ncbi:MAG TPA: zinc ribbon domain-containing protein [Acidobacteriota bacterium]|nr:zinc ribbon domain-containing protein [Acidobacteriota bacterium]
MPLYEYRCESCGAAFEKLVMTSKRDEVTCNKCGSKQTRRQLSTFATSGGGGASACAPSGGFS